MEIKFDGKKALVTGAGKGIGRAVALKLAERGADVIAISRTSSDMDELSKVNNKIETRCLDISDWDTTKSVVSDLGPIDLLVNNAGVSICQVFGDMTEEYFDRLYNTNTKSMINITQIVAKGMKERGNGGSIVNLSSLSALGIAPSYGVYSSSKVAADQIAKCMAVEYGAYNIRINSVCPSVIPTKMTEKFYDSTNEVANFIKAKTPLRRFGEMDEIVDPILFLLSDKASLITGVVLPVEGGISACLI